MSLTRNYENPYSKGDVELALPAPFTADTKTPGLDVSGELYRVYTYPNGVEIRVDGPQSLWVKRSEKGDSHRLALANGNGVYIAAGWLKIEWKNKPGQPPVAW
jgi:hypothetical protein